MTVRLDHPLVPARGLPDGRGPYTRSDGQLYARRGGGGLYLEGPHGHLPDVTTVPETGR
jgi:hypothetical protein